jgi:hypothetical protein
VGCPGAGPDRLYSGDPLYGYPEENGSGQRLVVLDGALNLADALQEAFIDYEPQRVTASFYLFAPDDGSSISVGALSETLAICQLGAFWVEEYGRIHNTCKRLVLVS